MGIGILCYELAIGIPPFYSQHINDMYTKIQHGKLTWRRREKHLSREIRDFIAKLLVKDPNRRMGRTSDVQELTGHPFLNQLDMTKVYNKQTSPQYVPQFASRATIDLTNFEPKPVRETAVDMNHDRSTKSHA